MWGKLRQRAKEKLGKATNTQESQSIRDAAVLVDKSHVHVQKVYHQMERHCRTRTQHVEEGEQLSTSMMDYRLQVQEDLIAMSGLLERVATFQSAVEDLRKELTATMEQTCIQSLKKLKKEELAVARKQKQKYDGARLRHEGLLSDLSAARGAKKKKEDRIQELEQRVESSQVAFDELSSVTQRDLEDCNQATEVVIMEQLLGYMEAYHKYFSRGFRWCNEALPELEHARQYVEERTEAMGQAQIQRTSTLGQIEARRKTKVFGVSVADICEREGSTEPALFVELVTFVEENMMETEGTFRVSGAQSEITSLKDLADKGQFAYDSETVDPHSLSTLLKLFLREMPEPLLTYRLYPEFLATANLPERERITALQALLGELPVVHQLMVFRLFSCLSMLCKHSTVNKMGAANISTVMAPNILSRDEYNPLSMLEDMALANMIVAFCIQHQDEVWDATVREQLTHLQAVLHTSGNHDDEPCMGDVKDGSVAEPVQHTVAVQSPPESERPSNDVADSPDGPDIAATNMDEHMAESPTKDDVGDDTPVHVVASAIKGDSSDSVDSDVEEAPVVPATKPAPPALPPTKPKPKLQSSSKLPKSMADFEAEMSALGLGEEMHDVNLGSDSDDGSEEDHASLPVDDSVVPESERLETQQMIGVLSSLMGKKEATDATQQG